MATTASGEAITFPPSRTSPTPALAIASSPLVYVRGDTEYRPIKRRIRFALEVACLGSEAHVEAAVKDAIEAATFDLGKQGFEYEPGFLERAPVEAVKREVRNFLRQESETGVRQYGDEMEDTDAQVLPHITRSINFTPDPGYVKPPTPLPNMTAEQRHNFKKVCDAVAAVERGRVAKDMPALKDVVDIRMRLTFRERVPDEMHVVPSSIRSTR